MADWLGNSLGIYTESLQTYGRRAEVLASNLSNADTPGYKARDIDFRSALAAASGGGVMRGTHAQHIMRGQAGAQADLLYRTPQQPSLDGNTVESPVEQAAFADNAVRFQASLRFLDGSIKTMLLAIKGE